MSLYFWVIIASVAGPFFLSFDKKVHFYTYWKALFPAISIVALTFIFWDEIFTSWGLWGFNRDYLNGLFIGHLPIEEICFFLTVPYACVFLFEVLAAYFLLHKSKKIGWWFALIFTPLMLLMGIFYIENLYTSTSCFLAAFLTIGIYFIQKVDWFGEFCITYFVVQIPFFIVNGILTGMVTEKPIVWYNKLEITNVRIGTIPIEDIFYNYSMLLMVFFVYKWFKKRMLLNI